MITDDKECQKEIVRLSKEKNLRALFELLRSLGQGSDTFYGDIQSAKMAINLSANLMSTEECVIDLREFVNAVKFQLNRFPDLKSHDNIVFSLVKIHLRLGALNDALDEALSSSGVRLRTFSAILDHCGETGNFETARVVWAAVVERELVPSETEFKCMLKALKNSGSSEIWKAAFVGILKSFANYHEIVEKSDFLSLLHEFLESKGVVVTRELDLEGSRETRTKPVCPVTGLELRLLDLCESEREEMLELTRRLAVESIALREDAKFHIDFDAVMSGVVSSDEAPSIILDAANIAHTNQNYEGGYFRFDQVDDVLEHFKEKRCIVVIHEKWLNPERDLSLHYPKSDSDKVSKKKRKTALPQLGETLVEGRPVDFSKEITERVMTPSEHRREIVHPVPLDLIEKWRRANQLMVVPHGQNDDWFWMHLCLLAMKRSQDEVFLVSNDQMRDHFWRMKNPKFFDKFRGNHVCQFAIQYGEDKINHYTFKLPPPFSISIQSQLDQDGKEVWHIPYRTNDLADGVRWLVFRL
jgi:pentatricopeptide repeat protein